MITRADMSEARRRAVDAQRERSQILASTWSVVGHRAPRVDPGVVAPPHCGQDRLVPHLALTGPSGRQMRS